LKGAADHGFEAVPLLLARSPRLGASMLQMAEATRRTIASMLTHEVDARLALFDVANLRILQPAVSKNGQ